MSESGKRWQLAQLVGMTLIILGAVAMLAAFPFIYGDPGPGQAKHDPAWFGPVATSALIALGLGTVLLSVSLIHHRILRRHGRA